MKKSLLTKHQQQEQNRINNIYIYIYLQEAHAILRHIEDEAREVLEHRGNDEHKTRQNIGDQTRRA